MSLKRPSRPDRRSTYSTSALVDTKAKQHPAIVTPHGKRLKFSVIKSASTLAGWLANAVLENGPAGALDHPGYRYPAPLSAPSAPPSAL